MKDITFYADPGSAESDWRQRASCRDHPDPDLFFPIGNTGPAADQIEAAKQICTPCAVRHHCLDWALRTNQDTGVWGGLSEDERKAVIKERRRQPSLV